MSAYLRCNYLYRLRIGWNLRAYQSTQDGNGRHLTKDTFSHMLQWNAIQTSHVAVGCHTNVTCCSGMPYKESARALKTSMALFGAVYFIR